MKLFQPYGQRRVLGVLGSEKSWFFLFLYGRVLVVDYEYDLENFVSGRFFLEIELKKAEKPWFWVKSLNVTETMSRDNLSDVFWVRDSEYDLENVISGQIF